MAKTTIVDSTHDYEKWLRAELKDDVVEKDLRRKHKRMADDPFRFLRATYWRWAETILDICPDLADAPEIHDVLHDQPVPNPHPAGKDRGE